VIRGRLRGNWGNWGGNWGQAPFSEVPVPFHVSPTAAVFAAHPADSTVRPAFTQSTILDGYDAWGRIIGLRHYKVAGDTDIAKLEYGYSKGSDRLYQKETGKETGRKPGTGN